MQKLKIKVDELIKYKQQVIVEITISEKDVANAKANNSAIISDCGNIVQCGYICYLEDFKNNAKDLVLVMQSDYFTGNPSVRKISISDIKHIEIVQVFGGGACTLHYARDILGLKIPNNLPCDEGRVWYYISEDDLEQPSVVSALTTLSASLTAKGIEHSIELEAGEFNIAVEVSY